MAGRPRRALPRAQRPALDEKAAKVAAVELLALKAWSTRELTQRLRRRGAPPDIAQSVVADLKARGYLDDDAFARRWAQTRAEGRRVGSLRLRQELMAKGLPRELIAAAIEAAFTESSEFDRAVEAGRRRLPVLRRSAPERAPAKLAAYLLRRGYPPSVVRRAVKELVGTDPGEPTSDSV